MKKIVLISLLSSFSSLSLAISEGPVITTNTKGGALVIESTKSASDADYFMSLDSDGVITLKPSKPITDADWYFSDEIIAADDAKDYCGNLSGSWRSPTTLETSTETAKLSGMNENVRKFITHGASVNMTAVTYFNGEGFKFGLVEDQIVKKWFNADASTTSDYLYGLCIQQ